MEGFYTYTDELHLIPTGLAKGGSKLEAATGQLDQIFNSMPQH